MPSSFGLPPARPATALNSSAIHRALPGENVLESAALDKGCDTNAIRARLSLDGIEPVIPGRSNRVERFFNKLKQFRRIATRYEKHPFTFLAMIHTVAAFISSKNE